MTLSAHTTHPEPPRDGRGFKSVWPDRFGQMLDQVPGRWIDATAAWGCKKSAATGIRSAAKKLELNVEARLHGDHVYVKIQ